MEKKIKITSPRYQIIATDIASKIVDRHYKVGEKIYTRSVLASQYGVSSETARKAISILSHFDIVETIKGSGVIIKSYENAIKFVKNHQEIQSVNNLKKEILESAERQKKENEFLHERLSKLIDRTERFTSISPFVPFEIKITTKTPHINKTISEINFWHNTSATIIAIERNNELIISPGPYAGLLEDDIFYFIGDSDSNVRVNQFIYPS
jgi:K+/H+ antiporter YhaU regulatory subunit KhtT